MTTIDRKEIKRLMKAEKEAEKHSMARNLISRRTNLIFNILLVIFCILIIFPLWIIIVSSLTSEQALTTRDCRKGCNGCGLQRWKGVCGYANAGCV